MVIVGGGLAGLALGDALERAGVDYQLLEARPRLGGRIKTGFVETEAGRAAFDLGPSWFWPGQPRVQALVERLGLEVIDQYSHGALSFEDETAAVSRGRGYASMEGSYRLAGGMSTLIDGLASQMDSDRVHQGMAVRALRDRGHIELLDDDGQPIASGSRVILALPPRVAAKLSFEPSLPVEAMDAAAGISTWMAGQAKCVAVYETPFWQEMGLSGDAMSRFGPMVEIHDASDHRTGKGALFGFLGEAATARAEHARAIQAAAIEQLARIFGEQALIPITVFFQDWATEHRTATELDAVPAAGHPTYGLPHALRNLWDGRLLFGSTEVAARFGGYLEGALEAAEQVVEQLARLTPRLG